MEPSIPTEGNWYKAYDTETEKFLGVIILSEQNNRAFINMRRLPLFFRLKLHTSYTPFSPEVSREFSTNQGLLLPKNEANSAFLIIQYWTPNVLTDLNDIRGVTFLPAAAPSGNNLPYINELSESIGYIRDTLKYIV